MPNYSTGELANLCGVTVRTVQYYDKKDLLKPSQLSEGGRRLYTEADLQRLQVICLLRQLGLSLDTIRKILQEENSREVITLLLTEQSKKLALEMAERRSQIEKIHHILRGLKAQGTFSMESLPDIADCMENRKKLHKTLALILVVGILMTAVEVGTVLLWIFTGNWIPFAVGMPLVLLCGVVLTRIYYRRVVYICPDCHQKFQPKFWAFFFAGHTPRTRKLTCPACGHKSYCIETAADDTAS